MHTFAGRQYHRVEEEKAYLIIIAKVTKKCIYWHSYMQNESGLS